MAEPPGSGPPMIELELVPEGEGGVGTATLTIGHIKFGGKVDGKPSALEFSFEGINDDFGRRGFSVDLPKGNVDAGTQKQVDGDDDGDNRIGFGGALPNVSRRATHMVTGYNKFLIEA